MNFNNYINDKWDSEGYFRVTSPQSFTMPAHDVLFVNKTYEDANDPQ